VSKIDSYDVALVGGGIMSATLGVILKKLNPSIRMVILERLDSIAQESSNPWNNAGTGHAALCELNYIPDSKDGSLPDPAKAIAINEQFQVSRQFWATLVQEGILGAPESFIRTVPHMTFVRGGKDVDYLKRRHEALKSQPLFTGLKYTEDPKQIAKWAPLLMQGRGDEKIAASFIDQGTDVDYGTLTSQMVNWLVAEGVPLQTSTEVTNLSQYKDGAWQISVRTDGQAGFIRADRVFVGAGGWALKLLQQSGIPEIKGYGTFPVSGHFLRTDNPEVVKRHQAKVYSQAAVGAPPMSVPHLDTRVVDGKTSLLFGPFAGLNPKFLKHGSVLDLPLSLRPANLIPYLSVAIKNFGLVQYLIKEVLKSRKAKLESLREFVPEANGDDWVLYEAGQRAQVIKPGKGGGSLQFGTEVISSADGSIAGLLGASPGASVSVSVMLDVISKLYPNEFSGWGASLQQLIPSYGKKLNNSSAAAKKSLAETAKVLKLKS
jgi:malate dehydrogenase (quinone)